MGLFLKKAVRSALDRGKVATSYALAALCIFLIAVNILGFMFFPRLAAPIAIVLSNVITLVLSLVAFRPLQGLIQKTFASQAKELVDKELEQRLLEEKLTSLENENRELSSKLDTTNQVAGIPSVIQFTCKLETLRYSKTGYLVKEEPLERFLEDPQYRLSDKKGIFTQFSKWMDTLTHRGSRKVLYIGKYYVNASVGIDFSKMKYALRDNTIVFSGARFSKLNDLQIVPEEGDVNHCWLLNEPEGGEMTINTSGLYKDFTEVYASIREKETAQALEQEVTQVCEHYTQVFRKSLLERFQGHVAFYDDDIDQSTDSWISLQETRDSRVVSMANNMFLVANVIHDSSEPSLK